MKGIFGRFAIRIFSINTRQSYMVLPKIALFMQHVFWISIFVIFPLCLDPFAFGRGLSAERAVLFPRALVLGFTWVVGILALLTSYPNVSLVSTLKNTRKLPFQIKTLLIFVFFLLINALLVPGSFAVNFIGSASRLDGFLLQACWFSLALISAYLVQTSKSITPWTALTVGSLLVAAWTILQAYGLEPVAFVYPELPDYNPSNIAYGPMALTGLTAAYLAVMWTFFFALLIEFKLRIAFSISLLIVGLVATGNRTSLAAVLIIIIARAIALLIRKNFFLLKANFYYLLFIVVSLVVFQLTRANILEFEQLERTQNLVQGNDNSLQARLIFWRAASIGLKDRPLTGVGPNRFASIFWRYTTSEEQLKLIKLALPKEAEDIVLSRGAIFSYRLPDDESRIFKVYTAPDKAHNYLLDLTLSNGIIGLGLFICVILSGVIMMIRSRQLISHAVVIAVVVYLLFGLTWFATLQVDPIVWTLFGIGIGYAYRDRAESKALPEHLISLVQR